MSDINLSYFPARLRDLRKSHKLTQAQMAARLGIAPASLSYYESGERLPDLRVMDTLYNEFDVSFEYMLGYTQSPLPPDPTVLDFLDLSPAACDNIVEHFNKTHTDNAALNILLESQSFFEYARLLADKAIRQLRKEAPDPNAHKNEKLLYTLIEESIETSYSQELSRLEKSMEAEMIEKGASHPAFQHISENVPNQLDDCLELLYKYRIYTKEGRPFPPEDQMKLNKHFKWLRQMDEEFEGEA